MGLERRKRSGNYIGGSKLIVNGQEIYNIKKFVQTFNKQIITKESTKQVIPPTTTTTTTIPITTCYIETQLFDDIVTQGFDKLIWC
jgi:hypothetical protein